MRPARQAQMLVHMVISRTGLDLPAPARPGEPAPPLSRGVTRKASLSDAGATVSRCRWAQASAVTARVHAQTMNRFCRPNARPWRVGIAAVARPPPESPFDTTCEVPRTPQRSSRKGLKEDTHGGSGGAATEGETERAAQDNGNRLESWIGRSSRRVLAHGVIGAGYSSTVRPGSLAREEGIECGFWQRGDSQECSDTYGYLRCV